MRRRTAVIVLRNLRPEEMCGATGPRGARCEMYAQHETTFDPRHAERTEKRFEGYENWRDQRHGGHPKDGSTRYIYWKGNH